MIDSFCNSVWGLTYNKVREKISKDEYKTFTIPKKKGIRTITYLEPESNLFKLQKQLCTKFLNHQQHPLCVKGFVKGENYHTFLKVHIGSYYFLRIDIKSFFSSISKEMIEREIRDLFYAESEDEENKLSNLVSDLVTLDNVLPQGTSTSPVISNLVMRRIDQRILKYCQTLNVKYTRYADDLLFSSNNFDFTQKRWFLKKIKYILKTQNFCLNYSKIKNSTEILSLNGYVVSKNEIRLSRNRLSDIRRVVSFAKNNYVIYSENGVEKFLIEANNLQLKHRDLSRYPFQTLFQFTQYLCGYRAYLISLIDHNLSTPFQKEMSKLIRKIESQIITYSD